MEYQGISGTLYQIENERIAGGGEGSIYRIVNNNQQVAKIFKKEKRDSQREKKLQFMVKTKLSEEQLKQITWPQDVIYDKEGFAGYIMPRLEKSESLTAIYSTGKYDLRQRLMVAYNLCAAINTVHSAGQICGDLNPQNICVNLDENDQSNRYKVTLVDTDSYHIVTPEVTFRCEVGLADYLAPEIQKKVTNGLNLTNAPLPTYTMETDLFALAVHIFSLLMNGCHPFACAKDTNIKESNIEQMTVESNRESVVAPQPIENIRDGFFPFYHTREGITYPIYAPEFNSLPEVLQKIFIRTFVNGYDEPSQRVKTDEWMKALEDVVKYLVKCDKQHYYFAHVNECPFCKVNERIRKVIYGENFVSSKNDFENKSEQDAKVAENPIEESIAGTPPAKKASVRKCFLKVALGILLVGLICCTLLYLGTSTSDKNVNEDISETFYSESTEDESTSKWIEKDFPIFGIKLSVPWDADCYDSVGYVDITTSKLSCYAMTMSVRQNTYISEEFDVSNFSICQKPDDELVEYCKKDISESYSLQSCEVINLGKYWFIKGEYNISDSDWTAYICSYYALDDDMMYRFELMSEIPISEDDISTVEQMISSMQIYHVPVTIDLKNAKGDELSLTEDGLWNLYLNRGADVDFSASSVLVHTFDGCSEVDKLMLPPGHYSAMLVYEDEYDNNWIESYYSSFDVPDDYSGADINVTIDK